MITRPDTSEYAPYYHTYISKVPGDDLLQALEQSMNETLSFFRAIPSGKWEHRYAPDKWTIKEVLQHLIDGERVFAYRALAIARGDKTSLPGFDENEYAANGNANQLSPEALLAEYESVRKATLSLFRNMSEDASRIIGTANNNPTSARALGFCIAGHEQHHREVVAERYL
ncbi:MAG: DinB family protein [Saprospiraceae bacterium]